ncbi:MAG TPA: hypothetical protein RMH85_19955 [Polyangiaceae bacterium LLY-WYZ-15_(1-7)]|nr:hypothetical protein [Myxococcales bacterium]MAT27410.1 hypothetical protein [Sandaracinus sp.]HJK92761.1 hypothetical protein [Polyangiaceae bacterium LLY-WYZ-15_(1-7)]MBJ74578.1 hypothetical protein [Sandaracinus sp.]HJL05563.1 hypothetical protein [Polyangiaceae bacterium LLY-WYZ-15_(1-7)]
MDPSKVQELYEEFVTGFLHRLFTGGEAEVTRALPPTLLQHFQLASASDPQIEHENLVWVHRIASEIAPVDAVPFPEPGAIAIAMAGHDLALLTDPRLDRMFARGARPQIHAWARTLLGAVAPPRTRGEALARHAVLDRILELEREDTVVKNWAYTYRFYGRPPPANVVAMPKLRFVREQKSRKTLIELWKESEELDLWPTARALLARSPVTELLRPDLAGELVFGTASLNVLSDAGLRHGVAQAIVLRGTGAVAQPFGHALRMLHALGPPPEYLYAAIAFLAELQILEVLDERAGHRPKDEPAVGDEELFAAVLPALFLHEGEMSHLLELAPPDLDRVRARAEKRREQAGQDAVDFARSILDRARIPTAAAPSTSGGGAPYAPAREA